MITIQAIMKKFSQVNGFKAPEEWYALVQRIADERSTTIGGAIQYVFNLGLPIYELVRANELDTIEESLDETRRELRRREIPYAEVESHRQPESAKRSSHTEMPRRHPPEAHKREPVTRKTHATAGPRKPDKTTVETDSP